MSHLFQQISFYVVVIAVVVNADVETRLKRSRFKRIHAYNEQFFYSDPNGITLLHESLLL